MRLADLTATRQSVDDLIARLDRESFRPTLILFPSTTPTLDARRRGDGASQGALRRAALLVRAAGVDARRTNRWSAAPAVDGMFVGEPEDGLLAIAALDRRLADQFGGRPDADVPPRRPDRAAPRARQFTGFLDAPYPAWDLLDLSNYTLPLVDKSYVIVETSRGCPYSCDFCVAPIHQGHKFREKQRQGARRRDRARLPRRSA